MSLRPVLFSNSFNLSAIEARCDSSTAVPLTLMIAPFLTERETSSSSLTVLFASSIKAPRNCMDLNWSAFWRTNARSNSLNGSGTPSLHLEEFETKASRAAFVAAISFEIFTSSSVSPDSAEPISLDVLPHIQHDCSSGVVCDAAVPVSLGNWSDARP